MVFLSPDRGGVKKILAGTYYVNFPSFTKTSSITLQGLEQNSEFIKLQGLEQNSESITLHVLAHNSEYITLQELATTVSTSHCRD